MCSTPQNCHHSTSRPYFDIISIPLDIKNLPNPTAPSELPDKPQISYNIIRNPKLGFFKQYEQLCTFKQYERLCTFKQYERLCISWNG